MKRESGVLLVILVSVLLVPVGAVWGAGPAGVTDAKLWLKADVGVIEEPGLGISDWMDQSGNGYDFTVGDTGRPVLNASAVNGKPGVQFFGEPDNGHFLQGPGSLTGSMGNDATAFMVFRAQVYPGEDYGGQIWNFGTNDSANHTPGWGGMYDDFGTTTIEKVVNSGLVSDIPYIYSLTLSSSGGGGTTTRNTYLNGDLQTTFASQTIGWDNSPTLGWGSYYWYQGYICEILIYSRVLTGTERNAVGAYLADKYGLSYTAGPEDTATPTFTPDGGSYSGPQNVTINCATPGATIYYTTDKSDPSETNGTAIAPGSTVNVDHTLTLKAVAYASGYNPSRVKAATYWLESFTNAGLKMWYKADAGVVEEPGVGVLRWNDQSDSGYYFVSAMVGKYPTLEPNAIDGQPAVHFAGLPGSGPFMTPPAVIDFGSNVSAFIVFRGQTYPGQNYGGGLWHFGNDAGALANHMPYMDQIWDDFGTTSRQMVASGYVADTPALYDVTLTTTGGPGTTTRDTFLDGVLKSSFPNQTVSWAPSGVNLGWGGYYYGRGYIAEIMIYDRVLSGAEKNDVGVYIEQKYGLNTAYPIPVGTPATIAEAKQATEGSVVIVSGAVISAAFTDFLYIETSDRSSGMRVKKAGHGLSSGTLADVTGAVRTDASTGERYIDATTIVTGAAAVVDPLGINNKAVGGGASGQQEGVQGGAGLNNIGLMVRIWGKVTGTASPYILDDGSGLNIKMVTAGGTPAFTDGDYVAATGVISCEKVGGNVKPILLVKDAAADVQKF